MKTELVFITRMARKVMQFASTEHYTRVGNMKEAAGELLGKNAGGNAIIEAVYVWGNVEIRDRGTVKVADNESEGAMDFFGDMLIGDFHSHPEDYPTASKTDKEEMLTDYPDGSIHVICGVWPKKRGGFTYKWKAYTTHLHRIYRVGIRFPEWY